MNELPFYFISFFIIWIEKNSHQHIHKLNQLKHDLYDNMRKERKKT